MTSEARAFVYLIDTLSYDARGGSAQPFATLEGAKASRPDIAEWKHEVYDDGSESWTQAGRDSISDVVEIVRVEVGP